MLFDYLVACFARVSAVVCSSWQGLWDGIGGFYCFGVLVDSFMSSCGLSWTFWISWPLYTRCLGCLDHGFCYSVFSNVTNNVYAVCNGLEGSRFWLSSWALFDDSISTLKLLIFPCFTGCPLPYSSRNLGIVVLLANDWLSVFRFVIMSHIRVKLASYYSAPFLAWPYFVRLAVHIVSFLESHLFVRGFCKLYASANCCLFGQPSM